MAYTPYFIQRFSYEFPIIRINKVVGAENNSCEAIEFYNHVRVLKDLHATSFPPPNTPLRHQEPNNGMNYMSSLMCHLSSLGHPHLTLQGFVRPSLHLRWLGRIVHHR